MFSCTKSLRADVWSTQFTVEFQGLAQHLASTETIVVII